MRTFFLIISSLLLTASGLGATTSSMWQVDPPTVPEGKELHLGIPLFTSVPAESIHSFNVLHYTLDIWFPMDTNYIDGTSTILCESRQTDLDSILLHCVTLNVDSILIGGKPLPYTLGAGNLYVDLDTLLQLYDTFEVKVFYNGYPGQPDTIGYYWFSDAGGMPETTAYTMTEPSDSRYWFPCYDEPWDKADMGCNINVEVPAGYVVASNGLLMSVDTVGLASIIYRWREDNSIATYLMSVAITKYVRILGEYVNSFGDTIPVQHFVYRIDSSAAALNFAKVPEMMQFYSSIFGEYPFAKYGMAEVQPFWGGMEHQTMTTILRWAAVNGWESGIAHELAHQWWGDMVTCFTWADIWINEGFATYAEALWSEYEYGFSAYQANMWQKGFAYFRQDSSERFPIYDPPILFNWGIVYCKGAWVLHMLRHIMDSDSAFFSVFPDFGQAFKYGNASTENFRSKAEEHYGSSLGWYFQEWVYDQGHPQYNYGWNSQGLGRGNYEVKIQIEQIQTNAPVFEMPIDIEIQTPSGDTTIVVWNSQIYQTFTDTLLLAAAPTGVSFDPGNWILDEHWEVPFNLVEERPLSRGAGTSVLRAGPNPFVASVRIALPDISEAPGVGLEIYDISGRRVKSLPVSTGAGQSHLVWRGLDGHGSPVSAGVYFARITDGTSTHSLKLLKLD